MFVSNQEFLSAIFNDQVDWCHVTDFNYDPSNIPKEKNLIAWKGDYNSRYTMAEGTNQYFTISLFYCDEQQQARRRKALYRQTNCIVLDDVREKLSEEAAQRLPPPSWILETSNGSEQWGFILAEPCTNRHQVDNLIDGFIASDLCPSHKDSGMAAVTRYVRLPEGSNSKHSKCVNGEPVKCVMQLWNPFTTTTMEALAAPFGIDLNRERREQSVDGAAAIGDHPLINIPEIIEIKEVRSDGRFDIVCPWVDEHTGADDSGSAIFTNQDGSMGFKCHHGACTTRTGRDLLRKIEESSTGFTQRLAMWQFTRSMAEVVDAPVAVESFMAPVSQPSVIEPLAQLVNTDPIEAAFKLVKQCIPNTPQHTQYLSEFLKVVESLPKIEQKEWQKSAADHMHWNKAELKEVLTDLRKTWYGEKMLDSDKFNDIVFVGELNQFYDRVKKIFYTPESFQHAYEHEEAEVRKLALRDGLVEKVDKIDYAPMQPASFVINGCLYSNLWTDKDQPQGVEGDASMWLDHFDVLGWGEHKKHITQWMAYTLRYPEIKINHAILLGGLEGTGKDFLLYPLVAAMADNTKSIEGEDLIDDNTGYLLGCKYLHVNEVELGDHHKAKGLAAKLKRLASDPPLTMPVKEKYTKRFFIRNIVNISMTTNSVTPVQLEGMSRRLYPLWSRLRVRDDNDEMLPKWRKYWEHRWGWMQDDNGWKIAINYLMNLDLSDFKPKQAPPVTEFLRDIVEDSKPVIQRIIETFITKQHGVLKCDLVTTSDIVDVLKSGSMFEPLANDPKYMTVTSVGRIMKQKGTYPRLRSSANRVWVLRNAHKYTDMTPVHLESEYQRRIGEVRGGTAFTVVPTEGFM